MSFFFEKKYEESVFSGNIIDAEVNCWFKRFIIKQTHYNNAHVAS